MIDDLFDFKVDKIEVESIWDCWENNECKDYCQYYSLTTYPSIFIGDKDHLNEIHDFLDNNWVDNWGFFLKNEEEKEEELGKMDFLETDEGKETSQ